MDDCPYLPFADLPKKSRKSWWWFLWLVLLNVGAYASVLVDRHALHNAAIRTIPQGRPQDEVVQTLVLHVRDELHHCNRGEVLRMPTVRRWNYLHNPFRIGPKTAFDFGGLHTGACGSSSRVLMEFLRAHDIDSRFVILLSDDLTSLHTLLEVYYAHSWGAVDPLYGIIYQHPDGRPASLRELRADEKLFRRNANNGWEYGYGPGRKRTRLPYAIEKYPFDNAHYFNFGKFGAVGRSFYHLLHACFGEESTLWIHRPNFYAYPALTTIVALDGVVLAAITCYCALMRARKRFELYAKPCQK